MSARNIANSVAHWYSKDGSIILAIKLISTAFASIVISDSVFGTSYTGIVILGIVICLIVVVHASFVSGALILKLLDVFDIINLSPETEMLRKGFGLITGIEDWYEMILSYFSD